MILTSRTSTSINVNWDLPDPLSRNGIITKHQLNYTEVSQPLNWTTVPLDASTSYLIEGLKIFTRYYVSVSAGTQITGFGPFSQPVVYRTLNDSKYQLLTECIVAIKTHDSESQGQQEASCTQRTSELFTRSTVLKFVNALNKLP